MALGDAVMQWQARLQKCLIAYQTDPSQRLDDALTLAEEAIDVFTVIGDDLGLTMAFDLRACVHNSLGRGRAASAHAMQGLRHAHRAGNAGAFRESLLSWVMTPLQIGDGTLSETDRTIEEITAEFGSDPALRGLDYYRPSLLVSHGQLEEGTDALQEQHQLALEGATSGPYLGCGPFGHISKSSGTATAPAQPSH